MTSRSLTLEAVFMDTRLQTCKHCRLDLEILRAYLIFMVVVGHVCSRQIIHSMIVGSGVCRRRAF
jgi:peptidoglycan/LPS O-acetylase OafA/YrhL